MLLEILDMKINKFYMTNELKALSQLVQKSTFVIAV